MKLLASTFGPIQRKVRKSGESCWEATNQRAMHFTMGQRSGYWHGELRLALEDLADAVLPDDRQAEKEENRHVFRGLHLLDRIGSMAFGLSPLFFYLVLPRFLVHSLFLSSSTHARS